MLFPNGRFGETGWDFQIAGKTDVGWVDVHISFARRKALIEIVDDEIKTKVWLDSMLLDAIDAALMVDDESGQATAAAIILHAAKMDALANQLTAWLLEQRRST